MSKFDQAENKKSILHEDSGFGRSFSSKSERVLTSKNEFNIDRIGTPAISLFHELLQLNWSYILILIFVFYLLINFLFAGIYFLIGPEGLQGMNVGNDLSNFMQCYFFSVQTFTTVGYGALHPTGFWSSAVAGIEALCGLLTFAIITGLVYSKFSKPNFKFLYSEKLLIAPYKDGSGAMFRVVNPHRQKLLDIEATMIYTYFPKGQNTRFFRTLELEIKKISMFPISWTINHPITDQSPLYGLKQADFKEMKVEFITLLSAYDEESGRTIKKLNSYHYSEIECNAKFLPMVGYENGKTLLFLNKVSEYQKLS